MSVRVCSSGTRYRVSVAALDAHQTGTPYADLARQVKTVLDAKYRPYQMVSPLRDRSGPFSFDNPAYTVGQQNIPASVLRAGHFMIFHDWEIAEERAGEAHIRVTETLTVKQDRQPQRIIRVPAATPPKGDKWTTDTRVTPLGECDTTLIYVDAPGSAALIQPLAGQQPAGFSLKVDQTVEVLDNANKVVDTKQWSLKIAVSAAGVLDPAN